MSTTDPTDLLQEALSDAVSDAGDFVELRFHEKRNRSVFVEKGRVDQAKMSEHTGVGVRVMSEGAWGFSSTDRVEVGSIQKAIDTARSVARASASYRSERSEPLPETELARGRFDAPGYEELSERPIEESFEMVIGMEEQARGSSSSIRSASCSYAEVYEDKGIVTSDGAKAWTRLVRPEFRIVAVAERDGEIQTANESVGATGGWECLFHSSSAAAMTEKAAKDAVDLLAASYPEGGRKRVLLSPALVGLLTHEAIGHTVEADFVKAGSCAAGRIGESVASELVTLCDSGISEYQEGAGGTLAVDDEGVMAGRTVIIQDGKLVSYLHDRESAAQFGVAPTGNARAWEFDNEPLIRMRNTYLEPGDASLEEMIEGVEDGYILDGPANGQADANGEFMFGTQRAWPIKNGKKGELMRGVNISGIAFDVLKTVDRVGRDFLWDLGAGHCGKGQLARVDAGGPWLSCEVMIGGQQA